jgi:hypothetical protein
MLLEGEVNHPLAVFSNYGWPPCADTWEGHVVFLVFHVSRAIGNSIQTTSAVCLSDRL